MNPHKLIRGLTATTLITIIVIIILLIIIWWLWKKNTAKENLIEFRDLWIEHGLYTRLYVVYEFNDQRTDMIVARLMKNQDDITNAVKKLTGNDPSKLNKLLKEHISQAAEIVKTIKVGKDAKPVIEAWYVNGDEIAVELNKLLPNKPIAALKAAMKEHLDTTGIAINKYAAGNAQGEIIAFDKASDHLKMMAVVLLS